MLLDAYCRERLAELVPNQNSFGHMHRWLKHDAYRHLAESPEGIDHPFTPDKEPYSLCPIDPGSLDLLAWPVRPIAASTAAASSTSAWMRRSTWAGTPSEACAEKGMGRAYLEFLKKIHGPSPSAAARCSSGATSSCATSRLVLEPSRDVIALEWGYEADYPFAENVALIAAPGRSFYVCPGTSSWNTLSAAPTTRWATWRTRQPAAMSTGLSAT